MVLTKRTSTLPLICQICGDTARGINFDVMTCMSCKAFFRRHAFQPVDFLQCQFAKSCKITQITRSGCSACRLKKCFSLGMNRSLIRHTSQNHRRLVKKKSPLLPTPLPINLLQRDSSTLTSFEWNLLSNIIQAYDRENAIEHAKYMLYQQSSLPPKLRTKSTTILDIIGFYYVTIESFIKRISYFQGLSVDARRAVIQHNSETAGTLNSMFIVRESNALDSSAYCVGCIDIYGNTNYNEMKKYLRQLEPNGTVFKIMLSIIIFSGNCSIVTPDSSENIATMTSTIYLFRTQNVLVTMLWKYLNYQYGFAGAVKCFNSFIKFILNMLRWTGETPVVEHWDMVDVIVENTARSLTIDN